MSPGFRIKASELAAKLAALDIDEGIRVEHRGKKMFINRNSSGIFVMQFDDSADFRYLQSAKQVTSLINSAFGKEGTVVWIY